MTIPPLISVTIIVRGFDASLKGTVTRSGVSCARAPVQSSVPSATPIHTLVFMILVFIFSSSLYFRLLLAILDQHVSVQRVEAQLRPSAADPHSRHPIALPHEPAIAPLRLHRRHR